MITGKLSSGFKFSVDETVIDSWPFVKAMGLCGSPKPQENFYGLTQMVSLLMGTKGETELTEFFEKKNGRCTQKNMEDSIKEILEKIKEDKEIKNSDTSPE